MRGFEADTKRGGVSDARILWFNPMPPSLRPVCLPLAISALILLAGCGQGEDTKVAAEPAAPSTSAASTTAPTTSPTSVVEPTPATPAPTLPPPATPPPSAAPTVPPTTASACEGAGCDGQAIASQVVVPTTSPYGSGLGASFHSPSNNIQCSLDEEQARCDVYENTWTLPPPPECAADIDWGDSVVVYRNEPATLLCHGDATNSGPELSYGTSVTVGVFTCRSETDGVTCNNSLSGHGFKVSRGSYDAN